MNQKPIVLNYAPGPSRARRVLKRLAAAGIILFVLIASVLLWAPCMTEISYVVGGSSSTTRIWGLLGFLRTIEYHSPALPPAHAFDALALAETAGIAAFIYLAAWTTFRRLFR